MVTENTILRPDRGHNAPRPGHMTTRVLTVDEPPVEERVVDEGLEDSHHTVLVLPQHPHHVVACLTEVALNPSHLGVITSLCIRVKANGTRM